MWIENSFRDWSLNMEKYDKITLSLVRSTVYVGADGIDTIPLYVADDHEQAKGVYEWIMQCLEKERPVCRISDAPVLRSMPEGSVTEWRMK